MPKKELPGADWFHTHGLLVDRHERHLSYFHDEEGKIQFINGDVEKITGYPKNEVVKKCIKVFLNAQDWKIAKGEIARQIKEKTASKDPWIMKLRNKSGQYIEIIARSVPHIVDGEYQGTLGSIRLLADEPLHEEMSEGVYLVDTQTKLISYANESLIKMFGRQDRQEVIGQYFIDFIHNDDQESVENSIDRLHKSKEEESIVSTFRVISPADANREVFLESREQRFILARRSFALGAVRDVTAYELTSKMDEATGDLKNVFKCGLKAFCHESGAQAAIIALTDFYQEYLIVMDGYKIDLKKIKLWYVPVAKNLIGEDKLYNSPPIWELKKAFKFGSTLTNKEKEANHFQAFYRSQKLGEPLIYPISGHLHVRGKKGARDRKPAFIGALLGFFGQGSDLENIQQQLSVKLKFVIDEIGHAIESTYHQQRSDIGNKIVSNVRPQIYMEGEYLTDILNITKKDTFISGASIFLKDINNRLQLTATTADFPDKDLVYEIGEGTTGRVAKSNRTMAFNNIHDFEENKYKSKKPFGEVPDGEFEGWVGIPIRNIREKIIGVFRAINEQVNNKPLLYRPFNSMEIFIAESITRQINLYVDLTQVYNRDRTNVEVISHEIQSSIASVKAGVDTCRRDDVVLRGPGRVLRPYLEYLEGRLDHLNNITEMTLLLFGGGKKLKLERTKIYWNIITYCVDGLQEEFKEKKIKVKTDSFKPKITGFSETPEINLDRECFKQVFHNLVKNAVKYSNPRKEFEMEYEIRRSTSSMDKEFKILIRDNGLGVPKGEEEVIFDFGKRGTNIVEMEWGQGYGLAVARRIVELHGGSLYLSNNINPTEFTIVLPIDLIVDSNEAYEEREK